MPIPPEAGAWIALLMGLCLGGLGVIAIASSIDPDAVDPEEDDETEPAAGLSGAAALTLRKEPCPMASTIPAAVTTALNNLQAADDAANAAAATAGASAQAATSAQAQAASDAAAANQANAALATALAAFQALVGSTYGPVSAAPAAMPTTRSK